MGSLCRNLLQQTIFDFVDHCAFTSAHLLGRQYRSPVEASRPIQDLYKAWKITDDRNSSFMCGKSADKESDKESDTGSGGKSHAMATDPVAVFFFRSPFTKSASCFRVDRRFYGPRRGRVCCCAMHDLLAIESFPMM